MWAIVPLKSPELAKSRLADVLNPLARRDLFFAVARHVITTLLDTPGISRVAVVTASAAADSFARDCGASVIRQDGDHGTAAAFTAAIDCLRPFHLPRLLMIAGDLPLLTAAAVEQMIAAGTNSDGETMVKSDFVIPRGSHRDFRWSFPSVIASAAKQSMTYAKSMACRSPRRYAPRDDGLNQRFPGVVIAPDRQRTGTNALLCSPPEIIAPCFGSDSYRRHREAAIACGAALEIVDIPSLALDIDVADDLDCLQRRLDDVQVGTDTTGLRDALAARRPRLKIVGAKP